MNTFACATSGCNLGGYLSPNYGVSTESDRIRKMFEDFIHDRFFQTTVDNVYISCLPILSELLDEYSEDNWDGYGASAIDINSYKNAISFLMAFPASTQVPEISVEPDGEVVFEWFLSWDRIFSISIGPERELHFAGLFDGSQVSGLEYFEDTIPKSILDQINKLFE